MTLAASLDAAIAAAIPRAAFDGVSIGFVSRREREAGFEGPVDPNDKTRWRVAFTDQATDAHKAAAAAVIAAFDPLNPPKPPEPTVADKLARLGLTLAELKAALAR